MCSSSKYYSRWWRDWWRAGSGLASTISLAPVQWRPAASLEHHLAQIEAYGRDGVSPLTPSPSPAMEEFTFGSPAMEPTMDEGEKVIQYRVSSVSSTWRPSLTPYLVTHVSLLVRTINNQSRHNCTRGSCDNIFQIFHYYCFSGLDDGAAGVLRGHPGHHRHRHHHRLHHLLQTATEEEAQLWHQEV